jgi:hypothetical protein
MKIPIQSITNSSLKNHEPVYELFNDLPLTNTLFVKGLSAFNEHADAWPGYDESCIAQN